MCAQSEPRVAGDAIPDGCRVIEVRVAELRQLFHGNDPSPFRGRDLDPAAERFIVDWSLLDWELVVPSVEAALAAASIRDAGYGTEQNEGGWTAVDPWGTRLRIVAER